MTRFVGTIVVFFAFGALSTGFGCSERRIFVTSEPSGATVIINDVNVGQTPVEVDFLYYGVYDVRLSKDGYEPILTSERIRAPLHEWPGFDVVAAVIPGKEKKHVSWHFDLSLAQTDADSLIARGRAMRNESLGVPGAAGRQETAGESEPIVVDEYNEIETQSEPLPTEPPEEEPPSGV